MGLWLSGTALNPGFVGGHGGTGGKTPNPKPELGWSLRAVGLWLSGTALNPGFVGGHGGTGGKTPNPKPELGWSLSSASKAAAPCPRPTGIPKPSAPNQTHQQNPKP